MGKYETTAVRAATLLKEGRETVAWEAWRVAAGETFPDSPSSRGKVAPREAFLELCHAGLVGVAPTAGGAGDDLSDNRGTAVTAARLLAAEPELASGKPTDLWRRLMKELGADPKKRHNGQMDVVLALWEAGLVHRSALD